MFCSNTAINLVIISILVLQIKYGYSSTIERVDNGENDNEDIDEFLLKHIEEQCIQKCPDQDRTNSEHMQLGCGNDCYIKQYTLGCRLWEKALDSTCKTVCDNKTDHEYLGPKELYCVMGCNDAVNRYFKWLQNEIGTPGAPALVADSLTATSLSLEWGIPEKLVKLTHGRTKSYLVQWRYEEVVGDWKFCRNQSIGDNSTVRVDNLQPYTKYRFRVALSLSPNYNDILIISQQSVIISTLPRGIPSSEPVIVRVVAVDHNRISVSWEAGPFPNGPILSYVLQIRDLAPFGYSAIKDIPASDNTNYYLFEKITPKSNYSINVSMRNAEGEGPSAVKNIATPKEPELKDDEPEPILILGGDNRIFSQGSDLLSEPAVEFYESKHQILGIAIHIDQKLIFVADRAGYVFRGPLEKHNEPRRAILEPHSDVNFAPILLSVDWLNNHLYILGQVTHPNSANSWQISRCDLNGKGRTVALSGLQRKPDQIEVDPYNGYLFWVVTGTTHDTGLFRLDLANISNGVKHDDKPSQLIRGNNLGAFAIDHVRFRLLVPFQSENTIYSLSLDGKGKENIRNNTQKPQFEIVKSLAYANGLFYWTNGEDIFTEDYHKKQDSYYHNNYYHQENSSFHFVCVNLMAAQPIPIPVNPPSKVQAILNTRRAHVSWRIPHLLGNQGKAAWQKWQYELELLDNRKRKIVTVKALKENTHYFDNLKPNTQYIFRVAAYTSAGKGPWSQEFKTKSLKSSHERFFIIASNNGLFKSDVFGEPTQKLIPKSDGDNRITDIAWFEDIYYIVENNTLKLYNITNNQMTKLNEIDSIESIAIDWISRKLYWSNPSQQLITRANLSGMAQEPLSIVAPAREIKIDALRGYIYYSTGNAVYANRLNGRNLTTYFMEQLYSGKQVMGLTMDIENQMIYWIVRSYDMKSYLYSAPMVDMWQKNMAPVEAYLEEKSLQGPLVYFSDRLMWIQSNNTISMSDVSGKYLSHIKNNKFHGLKRIFVVDTSQHIYPNTSTTVTVIPEQVNAESIYVISGDRETFNITWEKVKNVNYGQIFYEVRIYTDTQKEFIGEFNNTNIEYPYVLLPYTEFKITIRAFTYWGSSITHAILYSPTAPASPPTQLRIYQAHNVDLFSGSVNIEAILRWAPPTTPNGPILGYEIHYSFYDERITERVVFIEKMLEGQEKSFSYLLPNKIYNFEIRCYSESYLGVLSESVTLDTRVENRVPQLLVAWQEQIYKIDLDLNVNTSIINTGNQIMNMTYLEREERVFWFNENYELFSYIPGSMKTKLLTANARVLGLTIDWIERILYWAEITSDGSSSIQFLDLNRLTKERVFTGELLIVNNAIELLMISPRKRQLFWLEKSSLQSGDLELFYYDLDDQTSGKFYNDSTSDDICEPITQWMGNSEEIIIWQNEDNLKMVNIETTKCFLLLIDEIWDKNNFVRDSQYFYWFDKNRTIFARNDSDHLFTYALEPSTPDSSSISLLAYFNQKYPSIRCLIPSQENQNYKPVMYEATENSITLNLPMPKFDSQCSQWSHEVRYTIYYKLYDRDTPSDEEQANCGVTNCSVVYSHTLQKRIEGLKPYSLYLIQIGLNNYYGEEQQIGVELGPLLIFSTEPGPPSTPRNIEAESISQTEAMVNWMAPEVINSKSVWYEIHWQTEHIVNSLKNKQQKLLNDELAYDDATSTYSFVLGELLPNQFYTLWIRAYSSEKTFAESNTVNILTYPEPRDMELKLRTPTELEIDWDSPENVTKYSIQYSAIGSTNWATIYDSVKGNHVKFIARNLLPKTQYRFVILLTYTKSRISYVWPPDQRFVFETLGDIPSSPGKPLCKKLKDTYYHVVWEPSKDNGAEIEYYSLEVLEKKKTPDNRVKRSTISSSEKEYDDDDEDEEQQDDLTHSGTTQTMDEVKPFTIENQWVEMYNGTDAFWSSAFPQPITQYKFRVRAKNLYGWGPYSQESEQLTEPYLQDRNDLILIMIMISIVLVVFIVLAVSIFWIFRRKLPDKQIFSDAQTAYRSDVELANLRELPGNRIHTNSLLYNSGPMAMDSDIALLPQIRKDQIKMTVFLGSGAFGEVHEGIVQNVDGEAETRVAIKSLRKGATDQEKDEFLQEAQLMSNFKYEHILKLIGVCLDNDSLYIIMELMLGGDLQSYLRQNRPIGNTPSPLTLLDLISMCVDVASGCRYLEEMHFVHRDLACRNCLVSSTDPTTRVVKIGDFGLARDIYKNDYYRKVGQGLLPVRWMSPESLMDGVYTSQSDIWSFGVLCWEIMTLGQQPYPARNNVEVLHFVRDGGRLGRPVDCPEELHQLMLKCWSYLPEDRPTFRECLEDLKLLQEKTSDSIQIVAEFPNKNNTGGFFNRSYLLPDPNHNINNIYNNNNLNTDTFKLDNPIDSSRESCSITTIPKYLELVHDDDDDDKSEIDFRGGYEIPINEILTKDDNNNGRTFSSSSTISNLSTPLNNIDNNFITSNINREVIGDEFSSIDQLIPNNVQTIIPNHKHNQSITIDKIRNTLYSNSQIDDHLRDVEGTTIM